MDTRAEELLVHLADIVDLPPFDQSERLLLSRTLAVTSLHYAASARALCANHLAHGAAVVLRSQFEGLVRSVWVYHCASETHVQKLSPVLSPESQQASKNIPQVNEMLTDLDRRPQLKNLMVALGEFKSSSWLPLNSFVHAGLHPVHWTKWVPPLQLLDQIYRSSNGLAVLAFQNLAVLTGRPGLQQEVIAACASFSGCLPDHRPDSRT